MAGKSSFFRLPREAFSPKQINLQSVCGRIIRARTGGGRA